MPAMAVPRGIERGRASDPRRPSRRADRAVVDRARRPRSPGDTPAALRAPRLDWRDWLRRLPAPRAWLPAIRRLRAALIPRPAQAAAEATARTVDPTLPATAQIVAVQHPSVALPE